MSDPIWIDQAVVLAIHARQIREHGGLAGIRDSGMLGSALARPQQIHAYAQRDLSELAAAYTYGIIKNHPFVDGNKRTGFVVGILFLDLNGFILTANEDDATQVILDLTAGKIGEAEYARWLDRQSEKRR